MGDIVSLEAYRRDRLSRLRLAARQAVETDISDDDLFGAAMTEAIETGAIADLDRDDAELADIIDEICSR